jgi:hypothetical protein
MEVPRENMGKSMVKHTISHPFVRKSWETHRLKPNIYGSMGKSWEI